MDLSVVQRQGTRWLRANAYPWPAMRSVSDGNPPRCQERESVLIRQCRRWATYIKGLSPPSNLLVLDAPILFTDLGQPLSFLSLTLWFFSSQGTPHLRRTPLPYPPSYRSAYQLANLSFW